MLPFENLQITGGEIACAAKRSGRQSYARQLGSEPCRESSAVSAAASYAASREANNSCVLAVY